MKLGLPYERYDSGQLAMGVGFVVFVCLTAVLILPGAAKSQSAVLYIAIFGGLFSGVPATLGVGVIVAQLKLRKKSVGPR